MNPDLSDTVFIQVLVIQLESQMLILQPMQGPTEVRGSTSVLRLTVIDMITRSGPNLNP